VLSWKTRPASITVVDCAESLLGAASPLTPVARAPSSNKPFHPGPPLPHQRP
jgi:hypothetical protein